MFSHPDYDGHQSLLFAHDAASGLRALIAIHDTTLGPAFDGRRMAPLNRCATLEDLAISVRVMPFRANVSDYAALGRQC